MKHEPYSWVRPVCPWCAYEMRAAWTEEEFLTNLFQHYEVCEEIGMGASLDLGYPWNIKYENDQCPYCREHFDNPEMTVEVSRDHQRQCDAARKTANIWDSDDVQFWNFPERSPFSFRWTPFRPNAIWIFADDDTVNPNSKLVHGYAINPNPLSDSSLNTWESAIEASKRYIMKVEARQRVIDHWNEHGPEVRVRFASRPSYLTYNRQAPDAEKMLSTFASALTFINDWTQEQAELRLRIMVGDDLPSDKEGMEKVFGEAVKQLSSLGDPASEPDPIAEADAEDTMRNLGDFYDV